jgi:glycosyltransferase involved in cell wall biosynthesis
MVLLFSNERVIRDCNNYFARIINFTDFLVLLSNKSAEYRLALLCDSAKHAGVDTSRLTPVVGLTGPILELPYPANRYQSFIYSLWIAWLMRRYLRQDKNRNQPLAVASPGLNSVSFVLSFLLPRRTRWYLFIRGDTRKTVEEIYRHSLLGGIMTGVIDLFQWRVNHLMKRGRGQCFVFGQALKDKFYSAFPQHTHVVSPLLAQDWLTTPAPRAEAPPATGQKPRVLFVGRLSAEKNIAALVEACAAARPGAHRFTLTIVGDGPLEAQLRQRVSALGLDDDVVFTGRVSNGPQLIAIYDSHDIFCLPSATEGTPRAIAESVARGLPVVASDVGSIRHMFDHGVLRLLDGFDAPGILAALAEVIDDLPRRIETARATRAAAALHSLDFNVDKVDRIIQQDLHEARSD